MPVFHRRLQRHLPVLGIAALLASAGCVTTPSKEISYAEGAQAGYEQGMEHLEDHSYELAIAAFEQVRTKFPYSTYAALSALRIADTDFRRGRFLEAIDGYQRFLRFHPRHELIDWASFRIGESHFRGIPSGFFIFPPPSERDQTEARSARKSLADFLERFPESEHAPRAQELLDQVMELLVRHEIYAAEFYESRKKWAGAAGRYQYALRSFPTGPHVPDAMLGLASSLEKMGEHARAVEVLDELLATDPGGRVGREARKLHQRIEPLVPKQRPAEGADTSGAEPGSGEEAFPSP